MNELAYKRGTYESLRELALFAGAGGGILGGHLLGWQTVCAVEREPYAASVLMQRQNDGILPPFPIWDDVCTFDGKPWRGLADVVSGGFPCQDISAAGNGAGIDGERSGLWREMARIIGEVRPRFVFVENSPLLVGRGLAVVVCNLAEMGYGAQWCCISASDLGAPHKRDRIWLVAYASELQRDGCDDHAGISMGGESFPESGNGCGSETVADSSQQHEQGKQSKCTNQEERQGSQQRQIRSCSHGFGSWPSESGICRVANGVAARVDRLKAAGNGQVCRVAAAAFSILSAQKEAPE